MIKFWVMAVPPEPLEPLFFHRLALGKPWGGETLARRLGIAPPADGRLGETWEVSDYPGKESVVRGGRFDGQSLRALMAARGGEILGDSRPSPLEGRFPLLIKLIEADEPLSVQIHPPDGPLSPTGIGKTEAWYVLDVEPGAELICGLRPGTRREQFEPEAGDARVERHLHRLRVQPGDCVFVPAGMTHAIGKGITLAEVQQTSDVTFRMYDWGRPREVHLRQALRVVDYGLGPGRAVAARFAAGGNGLAAAPLARCGYFEMRALRLAAPARHRPERLARVLLAVRGGGQVASPRQAFAPRRFGYGDAFLLPGTLDEVALVPDAGGAELLEGIAGA